ncbi:MAG: membrane dipeptidase [Flexilinea sp.]|nr:membrane dipeptidase [Flexilinea sp.]
MKNTYIIDSHEDLAYESLYGKFDYTRSVADNRKYYTGSEKFGCTIGWPEYQKGRVGIVFGTIFMEPPANSNADNKNRETTYETPEDFHAAVCTQLDFYDRLQEEHPDLFRRIFTRTDYDEIVRDLIEQPESEHPVGLVGLMEGCEYLRSFDDLDLYYERGIRLIGPVWAGGRWCAGTKSTVMKDALTDDGKTLLRKMSSLGYVLDVSHMKNRSAMDALDYYDGIAAASHVNCNALLPGFPFERHFNDETIKMLIEHKGVMGVIPFNFFLMADWDREGKTPRSAVTLDTLANHIDHICQLAGNSLTAAIGSDLDGGFGYPEIPYEMNDISDLQKLADILERRGYSDEDVENIFHKNWQRILERALK